MRKADRTKFRPIFLLAAGIFCGGSALAALLRTHAAWADQPAALNVPASELVGRAWINTPRDEPIRLGARRGKVTVVQFWTFIITL